MGRDRQDPSAELSRLWRYRLGISGIHAKYRVVPRSAIVAYPELQDTVRCWDGEPGLQETIRTLSQRHGAPSPELVESFLATAVELDARGAPLAAKREVLESWLHACRPRPLLGAVADRLEVMIAFLARRIRQRTFRRPLETGRESLASLRRAGVR